MKRVKILSLTLLMSVFCVGMTFALEKVDKTIKIPPAPSRIILAPGNANMEEKVGTLVIATKSAVKKTSPRSK